MNHTLVLLASLAAVSGCLAPIEPADLAVASYPAAFAAEALARGDLRVVDVGASGVVHDYEPSSRDLAQLRQTTHLVIWDEAVEAWAHRAQESLGDSAPDFIQITALPQGEPYLGQVQHDGEGSQGPDHDPHTWNDPLAMNASVAVLADYLATAYPESAAAIHERANLLSSQLEDLHAAFETGLQGCARDTIVTNHEAHNYVARRYGFDVFALHGLSPGSEPSPATVNQAIQKIRDLGLPAIFIEEGTDPGAVRAIQDETGVQIRVLNTNEVRPPTGDYLDAQQDNLEELRFALGCP